MVKKLISDYPIEAEEPFSIIGDSDKTLEEIYKECPMLIGITYTVKDKSGNKATVTRKITVK